MLARFLGPEGRGALEAALLWPIALVYLGNLGLIDAIVYFSANKETSDLPLYATAVGLGLIQSLVLVPVAYFALPSLLSSQDSSVIMASRLYLLVIPVSLIAQYGRSVLQGHMQLHIYNMLRLITPIGYFLGVLCLTLLGSLDVLHVVLLQLGLNIIVLFAGVVTLRRKKIPLGTRLEMSTAIALLRYGLKIHIGRLSGLIISNSINSS